MNKGLNYVLDIMGKMGIKRIEELLVDGTGLTEDEKNKAIGKAIAKINNVINEVWRQVKKISIGASETSEIIVRF